MALGIKTVGNLIKWASYHGSTGGIRNLGHSLGVMKEASHLSEISKASLLWRAPATVVMAPLNALAHGLGMGVRGVKGYGNLWKNSPLKAAGITAAPIATVAAVRWLSSSEKGADIHPQQQMADIGQAQAQSGQMLELLQASEPQPQQLEYSALQQARPQIASASAAPQGVVAMGPAVNQGVSA